MHARLLSLRRRWDVLAAVALVGLAFVPGIARQGVDLAELSDRGMDALGWVLLVAQGAGIAFLRRVPLLSLVVVGGAFAAYQLRGYPTTFAALGLLVAVVGAGALVGSRRRVAAASAAAGYALLAVGLSFRGSPADLLDYVGFGVLLAALWIAGAWLRARGKAQEQRRRQAEAAAVDAERGRIARELHDVVTHHVTAMVIQADAAQYGPGDPDHMRTVFDTIAETGRSALTDLRGLLGALDASVGEPARTPAVTDVELVVALARGAGQPVELLREGEPRALDAATALAVTRVVQESLTNALRHAPGAATRVRVRYDEEEIDVTITTETATAPGVGRGGGRGLIGLRERVALAGGVLDAGPVAGGFVVHARVPA